VRAKGQLPDGMVRVIDESGEDYLFDENRFVAVELPPKARKAIAAAGN
jgi:hypothetical protein